MVLTLVGKKNVFWFDFSPENTSFKQNSGEKSCQKKVAPQNNCIKTNFAGKILVKRMFVKIKFNQKKLLLQNV